MDVEKKKKEEEEEEVLHLSVSTINEFEIGPYMHLHITVHGYRMRISGFSGRPEVALEMMVVSEYFLFHPVAPNPHGNETLTLVITSHHITSQLELEDLSVGFLLSSCLVLSLRKIQTTYKTVGAVAFGPPSPPKLEKLPPPRRA